MQVLAEIVPELPGLLHAGPQLRIMPGACGQQLVFPVQLRAAGILPCDPVHLVQK